MVTRREFVAGSVATALVAVSVGAPPAIADHLPPPGPAAVPTARRVGWWGFNCGPTWEGPFESREAAQAAAVEEYGHPAETAWCVPREMHVPDNMAEDVVTWLADDSARCSLDMHLVWVLEGANSDSDFDGEVSDALWVQARAAIMETSLREAVAAACRRHGRDDVAVRVLTWSSQSEALCPDDADWPFLDAVGEDVLLSRRLHEIVSGWVVAQGIADAPRTIDLEDREPPPAGV